jgi:hypothetical protein
MYAPPPIAHLQLVVLVSSIIINVSYYEDVYVCSSTTTFGISCPPPLKFCSSLGYFSLTAPLHSTLPPLVQD